ncbi:S8 family serine peptidase [Roseateles violae]|uniref:S8 family serine peptidase n=1 Tax=Roseateles violae TaxID=3058042 RepID=A0ABT8DYX4_9BURK|nr:S8 family serine peptidase [Pelomonas sp. PFR6]MDN3922788.1 S8 family serine peptidase [Pelomonas sp. PFR6]
MKKKKTALALLAVLLLLVSEAGLAQLRLPGLPQLPNLPPRSDGLLRQRLEPLQAPLEELQGLRQRLSEQLLQRHPRELARDPAGELILRRQLLALPSSASARERLLALPEVRLLEETRLDGLDLGWLLLQVDTALLPRLRALDPEGLYDYQHVYLGSGTVTNAADAPAAAAPPPGPVGLIDSGIDARHPALREIALERFGCAGATRPAAHGTAVASLLAGRDGGFRGALPGATLYAADAYCDAADGGSVQRIAQGLAWLVRERVGVINISLVGPPNQLLQRAVAAAQAKGHLIVAAVGNDGPAAPPLYPAAWPGVVAVTGVDRRRRALPEAGRGPHVMLAAPGSELLAADGSGGYRPLRGTSFAAPLVAALLAAHLPRPDPAAAHEALARLQAEALDLGASGRDEIYGWGLVGESLRTAAPR